MGENGIHMQQRLLMTGILTIICFFGQAQVTDTLIKKLDSLSERTDKPGGVPNNTDPGAYNEATKINFKTYFILLGSDMKQAFTKPFHLKKRDWGYLAIGAGTFAALTLVDKPIQQRALRWRTENGTVRNISSQVTEFGGLYEGYTLAAIGLYGIVFKKRKMQTTALLATQAYIVGATVMQTVKYVTGRTRPSYYSPNTIATPTFLGPFNEMRDYRGRRISSSFPSGHTTVAFAAATVFAREYSDRKWVPIVAYTAASLVGISRVTENKHWTSDVVIGAALGYLTGRLVVNNYHRYAKIKQPGRDKGKVSFQLFSNFGQLMPGVTYTFR
jgi:membrane-associated phospholipid phosphatase